MNTTKKKMNQKNKKTIEKLRQQQEATRGASDWTMLEEEIQALLEEEE